MATSLTMPRLGESVAEGTVTRWLKREGEQIAADEPLLEVSTDKVDTEIPSPVSGTLLTIRVREDETVEIGAELAVIGDATDGAGPTPSGVGEPKLPPRAVTVATARGGPDQSTSSPVRVAALPSRSQATAAQVDAGDRGELSGAYVTPLVRKLASDHGVDLSKVRGTGVGGRIRKSDVLAATAENGQAGSTSAPAPTAPAPAFPARATVAPPSAAAAPTPRTANSATQRGRVEPMSRMRQLIAARMVESLQTSAQLTTIVEVDITRIARLRERAKAQFEAREGVKLSFLPFFAIAAIEALKAHPVVNASIDMQAKTITYHDAEHLGVAVDTERGLLVPVIHNAGDLNLAGIARKIADLAERTRQNRIAPDELGGGTFTITNTGRRGALFDTPIINQPQVGILGTGAVVKRPIVVMDPDLGETIAVRSMMYLALSYDHRIVDGAEAARFLATLKERLETGAFERALELA